MSQRSPQQLRHLPLKVAEARESVGLSQYRLAKDIGISRSLMSEIEAGTRNATEENLQKIADRCGWEIEDLMPADVEVAGS